jgi:hypothetical protein
MLDALIEESDAIRDRWDASRVAADPCGYQREVEALKAHYQKLVERMEPYLADNQREQLRICGTSTLQ